MKPADLQLVREASERERAHYNENRVICGRCPAECYCNRCKKDRATIAAAAPWLLAYVGEAQSIPRRACSDFGDLD